MATISAATGGTPSMNSQRLALSPDGKLLVVSDAAAGGRVTILDTAARSEIAQLTMNAGVVPFGLAFHPDGSRA